MPQFEGRNRFRACLLTASLIFAPLAFGDIFESSPTVPPAGAAYSVPDTCIAVVCLENIVLSNFTNITAGLSGGNELTSADVDLTANVYQNVSGVPGAFLSPVTLTGDVDIEYFSKAGLSETGTFNTQLTGLDLSGSFHGLGGTHTIAAMLNPSEASTGQTSVDYVTGRPPDFRFSGFFDVFAELSIDGGPYVPGPERIAELSPTPEPAYYGAMVLLLAAMVVRRVVRTKRLAQ